MSRSILPALVDRLQKYLAEQSELYESQIVGGPPTLPATSDLKINVRAVADALGKRSWEQHLFKKAQLSEMLNEVAAKQGLRPVRARSGKPPLCVQGLSDVDEQATPEIHAGPLQVEDVRLAKLFDELQVLRRENSLLKVQMEVLLDTGVFVSPER